MTPNSADGEAIRALEGAKALAAGSEDEAKREEAAKEVDLHVPLVVRLEGTNVDLGKQILNESGIDVIAADDLGDAAEKVVKAVEEAA